MLKELFQWNSVCSVKTVRPGAWTLGRLSRFEVFQVGWENFRMLIRAARRRLSGSFGGDGTTKRYVVTRNSNGRVVHLGKVLRAYPKVILLDKLDDSTALVEMSDRDLMRLSRQHPELAIEPNIPYRKAE